LEVQVPPSGGSLEIGNVQYEPAPLSTVFQFPLRGDP